MAATTMQQTGTQPRHTSTGSHDGSGVRPVPDHREGVVARSIEHYTAQLPSDTFLWAAFGSIGLSLALRIGGAKDDAQFVGQWAPTFLLLGVYNKLVKVAGSDPQHRGMAPAAPTMASRGAGI